MQLENVDLLKLQTKYMQEDTTTQGFCSALSPQLQLIAEIIKNSLVITGVDELPEAILDQLAHELHVEWYNASASIEVKRQLIKNSDKVHMYMGTAYAVEQVVNDYFGNGYVEEWYEYDGQPYHFRVITSNPSVTGELADLFAFTINKVKRKSTIMDSVLIDLSASMDIYYGCVLHVGNFYAIEQVV